jgi:hypothetical protein
MEAVELRAALSSFIGTTAYYEHWTRVVVYTDGVKFLAESAGAYWLIDAIALAQPRALRDGCLREFQLWELFIREDRSATLVCSRDSDDEAFRREIEFSDFPMDYVKLYVEQGVVLLPTEH